MKNPFKLFFSFEVLFVAFLFAGQYKTDPRLAFLPVDLTLLFFLLSVFFGGLILFKRLRFPRNAIPFLSFFALFCAYSLLSTFWSPSIVYAREKTLKIITLVGWSLIAPLIVIGENHKRLERLKISLLLIAVWMALEGLVIVASGASGFLQVTGSNYLGLGRILGIGLVVALARGKGIQRSTKEKYFYLCIILLFLFIMLKGGGRGPLLALFGGWFITALVNMNLSSFFSRLHLSRRFLTKCALVLCLALAVMSNLELLANTSQTVSRIKILFSSEGYGISGDSRLQHWKNATALWTRNPIIGYGIGSWPILNDTDDRRSYPHNIVMEILVEMGMIGLLPFLLLFFSALKNTRKASKSDAFFLQMLLFVSLLNAMVSGDIPDNRFLFTAIGLCCVCGKPEVSST